MSAYFSWEHLKLKMVGNVCVQLVMGCLCVWIRVWAFCSLWPSSCCWGPPGSTRSAGADRGGEPWDGQQRECYPPVTPPRCVAGGWRAGTQRPVLNGTDSRSAVGMRVLRAAGEERSVRADLCSGMHLPKWRRGGSRAA